MQGDGWWCYSKMKANAIRLYSRGLSEQEIKKNYDSTILGLKMRTLLGFA